MRSGWVAIASCALTLVHTALCRLVPKDNRIFGELTLSHHATTGVSAYTFDHEPRTVGFTYYIMALSG